jgi:hypothetical protein
MTRHWRLFACSALLVLAACSGKERPPNENGNQAASSSGTAGDAEVSDGDPCGLLEVKEVEAAIGPLRDAPYRFNESKNRPDVDGGTCVYQAKDLRRIKVSVDWTDGAIGMKMLRGARQMTDQAMSGDMVTETGDTIAGAWDEVAPMPMNCCILEALLGDQAVTLDWTGTRLTTADGARLLDVAVQRLAHPLDIDGTAPVAAVLARQAAEPKDRDPCGLVTRAEAEAILGPLTAAPERSDSGHGNKCTYLYTEQKFPAAAEVTVIWTQGYVAFAADLHVKGIVGTRMVPRITGGVLESEDSLHPPAIPGPWDDANDTGGQFTAVRQDVMITVGVGPASMAKAQAFAAKAFSNLRQPE